jgi:hypothetical protein
MVIFHWGAGRLSRGISHTGAILLSSRVCIEQNMPVLAILYTSKWKLDQFFRFIFGHITKIKVQGKNRRTGSQLQEIHCKACLFWRLVLF